MSQCLKRTHVQTRYPWQRESAFIYSETPGEDIYTVRRRKGSGAPGSRGKQGLTGINPIHALSGFQTHARSGPGQTYIHTEKQVQVRDSLKLTDTDTDSDSDTGSGSGGLTLMAQRSSEG